jgi:hypothetical protein
MLRKGDLVVDGVRQRVGQIMDFDHRPGRGQVAVLRPPGGGREWEVPVDYCRQVRPGEVASVESLRHLYRECQ